MADSIGSEDRTQLVETSVSPPYLVIVDGPHRGSRFSLHSGRNTIGRLANSTVLLEDQSISRQHSVLVQEENQWRVEDLGSKNGTYVNGNQILERVVVGHKDLLKIGIYVFRLILQKTDPAEEMAPPPPEMQEGKNVVTELSSEGETGTLPEEGFSPAGLSPIAVEEEGGEGAEGKGEEEGKSAEEEYFEEEAPPPQRPRYRTWILAGLLFVVVVVAGLYFYWRLVLRPGEKPAETPLAPPPVTAPAATQVQSIPLGPPEPPPPQKVPVFLDCVASPLSANVRFQEQDLGRTPVKVNVELIPGEMYEAEATFALPEIQEQYSSRLRFQVERDQSVVPLLFRAPIGVVKFLELPRDATVYLEAYFEYDKFNGRPIKLQELVLNKPIYAPYGRYILEVRQPKAVGDAASFVESIIYRREFILAKDQPTVNLTINEEALKQFPADIRSVPEGANLFLDGQKVGVTPFVGMLPLGEHVLMLQKEGFFENRQDIKMDVSTEFKAEIKLLTSAAGEKLNSARAALEAGAYQESINHLSGVFELTPTEGETAQARYWLGKSYLKLGELDKADGYFQQASQNENWKQKSLLGLVEVGAERKEAVRVLPYLVEVLLNAKEDVIKKEANDLFHKISPFRSLIYIHTEPAGATVFVNDKKIEQATPVILHEISLGNYRVRLEKAGYKAQEISLSMSVNEFNPVLVTLQPAVAP